MTYVLDRQRSRFAVTPGWLMGFLGLDDAASIASLPKILADAVKSGALTLVAASRILAGERDVNTLTNLIFYARHPTLPTGYKIQSHEKGLTKEWLDIRDKLVKPLLQRLKTSPNSKPRPGSSAPIPQPANCRQQPQCVAEAIDLLENAREIYKANDWTGAGACLRVVYEWLSPLTQQFDRCFNIPVVISITKALKGRATKLEKASAELFVSMAIGNVRTAYLLLSSSSTLSEGNWNYTISGIRAARYLLEVLADEGVSPELKDSPPYRPSMALGLSQGFSKSQVRVLWWLRKYKRRIEQAERVFRIDRRAIAGAIAWEALENRMFITVSSVGPGKVHIKKYVVFGDDTLAKQTEDAGYLEKRSQDAREYSLSKPEGAIMYIAASMKAGADIACKVLGSDIYKNPCVLAFLYNAHDLKTWRTHLNKKKAKGEQTFKCSHDMSRWVQDNLNFLESSVGKPKFNPKHP